MWELSHIIYLFFGLWTMVLIFPCFGHYELILLKTLLNVLSSGHRVSFFLCIYLSRIARSYGMMVDLNWQLGRVKNHRRNTSLSVFLRNYLDQVNWGRKTHPQCRHYQSMGCSLRLNEKEEIVEDEHSPLPGWDTMCPATSCTCHQTSLPSYIISLGTLSPQDFSLQHFSHSDKTSN